MMAGKCGCAGTTCSCKIVGEGAVTVNGAGSSGNPYRIAVSLALNVFDSDTIDLSLLGDGSSSNPYSLTAEAHLDFGDLDDVDASVTTVGYVPARQSGGTFAMVPPVTAAVGAISVGPSIEGDGSSGDVLDVRLAPNAGLVIDSGGLGLSPYTVASEGELDTLWGTLEPGSYVSMADGSAAWFKSTGGWVQVYEDDPLDTVTSGNITAASGWTVNGFVTKRRSGIVTMSATVTSSISRTTSIDSGNIANINVATITQSKYRPVVPVPARVLGVGPDWAFYVSTGGVIVLTNLSQPDVTFPAGTQVNFAATYIGQ